MTIYFTEDFKSDFNSEFWNIIRMGIYWKFSCFCLFIGSFVYLFVCSTGKCISEEAARFSKPRGTGPQQCPENNM